MVADDLDDIVSLYFVLTADHLTLIPYDPFVGLLRLTETGL